MFTFQSMFLRFFLVLSIVGCWVVVSGCHHAERRRRSAPADRERPRSTPVRSKPVEEPKSRSGDAEDRRDRSPSRRAEQDSDSEWAEVEAVLEELLGEERTESPDPERASSEESGLQDEVTRPDGDSVVDDEPAFDWRDDPPDRKPDFREEAPQPRKSEKKFKAKSGFYIGAMFPYVNIDGDFDDETILIGDGEGIALTELEEGSGWGAVVGVRGSHGAFEVSYQKTDHDADLLGTDGEFNTVNLDFKLFLLPKEYVQPMLLFGLAVPWLDIEDNSINTEEEIGDSEFRGIGFNLGGGLSAYPFERVGLHGTLGYRFAEVNSAKGVNRDRGSVDDVDFDGWFSSVSVTYTF